MALWATLEAAEEHLVRHHTGERNDWTARVAARMYGGQACVWHASWLDLVERYETGAVPTVECPHCGGRADPRLGAHSMCEARAAHGLATPRLDVGAGDCSCHPCRQARGA